MRADVKRQATEIVDPHVCGWSQGDVHQSRQDFRPLALLIAAVCTAGFLAGLGVASALWSVLR